MYVGRGQISIFTRRAFIRGTVTKIYKDLVVAWASPSISEPDAPPAAAAAATPKTLVAQEPHGTRAHAHWRIAPCAN